MSPTFVSTARRTARVVLALALLAAAPDAASAGERAEPQPLSPPATEQSLLLPRFEVDTTSGSGTTTLFAVRNLMDGETRVELGYLTVDGEQIFRHVRKLSPREVWSVNLRDVDGLPVDADGFARGQIYVYAIGPTSEIVDRVVAGDYFHVDVEQGFATADEMGPLFERHCGVASIRFLDFGGGMDLTVHLVGLVQEFLTFTVQAFDQTGAPVGEVREVETTDRSLELELSELTSARFGTLVFDFSGAAGGIVSGRYRAEDRFSVSLPAVCEDDDSPKLSPPPPTTRLFLPRYTVDTTSGSGVTTLLAVGNTIDEPVTVNLVFQPADDLFGAIGEEVVLAPRQVRAINLRDVEGLPVDGDGIARGSVSVEAYGMPAGRPIVAADAFQVDTEGSFATGELLHEESELCLRSSIRFVDLQGPGGDGASFVVWLRRPPTERFAPAFTVRTYDERGLPVGEPYPVPAPGQIVELDLAQITFARFGSLVFDFAASESGLVLGRYSADGRFSVSLGSTCEEAP